MKTLLALAFLISLPAASSAQQASTFASGGGHSAITLTVKLGNSARINGRYFRPLAIVEDSRCPPNANCVWAGRLVIDAKYSGRTIRLESGTPLAVPGGRLTLVNATPRAPAGRKLPAYRYSLQVRFER